MSTDVQQDKLLRNVFAMTLDAAHADAAANPPVIYLSSVAEVWPPVDASALVSAATGSIAAS